jgi:hypothetical protein
MVTIFSLFNYRSTLLPKRPKPALAGFSHHSFTNYEIYMNSLIQSTGLTEKGSITANNCMPVLILPEKIIPTTEVSLPDS